MKCAKCANEMINLDEKHWLCNKCHSTCIKDDNPFVQPQRQQKYIKQNPYVEEDGIYVPLEEYVPEGTISNYELLISKEMFIEAYNKWIKGTDIE